MSWNFLKCAPALERLEVYITDQKIPTISPSRIPSVSIIWIVFINAPSIPRGIWKHGFHSENVSATLRRKIKVQQSALFWGKLGRRNHMIIMTPSFSKTSVFKTYSPSTRMWKAGVLKFLRFEERFQKCSAFENRARTRCGVALRLKQTAKVVSDYLLLSKNMFEELHLFLMILAKKGMFGIGL